MATITIDDGLASQLEVFLPPSFHGERKLSLRVDFALREWLQLRQNQEPQKERWKPDSNSLNPPSAPLATQSQPEPKRTLIQPIDEGRRREAESR